MFGRTRNFGFRQTRMQKAIDAAERRSARERERAEKKRASDERKARKAAEAAKRKAENEERKRLYEYRRAQEYERKRQQADLRAREKADRERNKGLWAAQSEIARDSAGNIVTEVRKGKHGWIHKTKRVFGYGGYDGKTTGHATGNKDLHHHGGHAYPPGHPKHHKKAERITKAPEKK